MNIQIKKPCSVYKMNGNTVVHDVTNMSNEEIVELLRSNCKVCITAKKSQLKLTWLQVAAAFLISICTACHPSKKSQEKMRGTGSFMKIDKSK